MAKKQILRKCQMCDVVGEKTINIESDKFFKDNKGFWHFDCYLKKISKEDGISLEEAKIKANDIYEDNRKQISSKDNFFYWLMEYHKVTKLSQFVYIRADEIVDGMYKNFKDSISYEELLDMYKRQCKNLEKIADQKTRTGTPFKNTSSRIVYDLAVLVGKYDSYKKWKTKQKIMAIQDGSNQFNHENNLTTQNKNVKINKESIKTKINNNEIDLDELF